MTSSFDTLPQSFLRWVVDDMELSGVDEVVKLVPEGMTLVACIHKRMVTKGGYAKAEKQRAMGLHGLEKARPVNRANAEKRRVVGLPMHPQLENNLEKARQANPANAEKRCAMGLRMPSHLENSREKARQANRARPSKLQKQQRESGTTKPSAVRVRCRKWKSVASEFDDASPTWEIRSGRYISRRRGSCPARGCCDVYKTRTGSGRRGQVDFVPVDTSIEYVHREQGDRHAMTFVADGPRLGLYRGRLHPRSRVRLLASDDVLWVRSGSIDYINIRCGMLWDWE